MTPPNRAGRIAPIPAVSVLLSELGAGLLFQYAKVENLKRRLEDSASLSLGSFLVRALSERL